MTIVRSSSVSGSGMVVTGTQAGDVVVLLAATSYISGSVNNVPDPSGWQRVGVWGSGYAWPNTPGVFGVWWKIAEGSSITVSTPYDGHSDTRWQYVVSRGSTTVAASQVKRQNAQTITYPGVDFGGTPYSGDVIYAGGFSPPDWNTEHEPAGSTLRQEETIQWMGSGYFHYTHVLLASSAYTSQSSLSPVQAPARTGGWAITLALGDVAGPDAPRIVEPSTPGATMDLAAGFDLAWVPSGVQTGYAVRTRKDLGAWAWWDGDGFDSATELVIDGTATSITVPAGELTNGGDLWTLQVATRGDMSRPELGQYAARAYAGWESPTAPSVDVTDTSAGVLTSFTPTITMVGSAAAGTDVDGYTVEFFDGLGNLIVDSGGLVASPWVVPVEVGQALASHNLGTVTISARTVQHNTQESDPTTVTFTLGVVTPDAPEITVSPYAHPDSGLPGTLIEVTPPLVGARVELARNHVHNPSAEVDATEWAPGFAGTLLSRDSTTSTVGESSVVGEVPAGEDTATALVLARGLTPGESYTLRCSVKASTAVSATVGVYFGEGTTQSLTTLWQEFTQVFTPDAAEESVGLPGTAAGGLSPGDKVWVDGVCVVETAKDPGFYFDGSSAPAADFDWLGEPHASPSVYVDNSAQIPMSEGTLEITRVSSAGRELIYVGDVADGWDVADYLAPTHETVHYEARVTTADTIPLTSPWGVSANVTFRTDSAGWITDPLDPSKAVSGCILGLGEWESDLRTTAMSPLGQPHWVVHSGVASDYSGELVVSVEGDENIERMENILRSGRRLFVRGWLDRGTQARRQSTVEGDIWIRTVDSFVKSRVAPGLSIRTFSAPYVIDREAVWATVEES